MKNINTSMLLVTGAIATLAACGSQTFSNKQDSTQGQAAAQTSTANGNATGASCANANQQIVAGPPQPNGETSTYRWTLIPTAHELFSASGATVYDPVGGEAGSTFYATLASVAAADANFIAARTRTVGQTATGLQVYAISLYDSNNQLRQVQVNEEVLSLSYTSSYPYDGFAFDENNQGARILWPSMWQKAAAVLAGGYTQLAAQDANAAIRMLLGDAVQSVIDANSITAALHATPQTPTLAVGISRPGSVPPGHSVTNISGSWCDSFNDNNYCAGSGSAYAVLYDSNGYISLRNPGDGNLGSTSTTTDGVQQHGVVDMPRVVFDVLFDQVQILTPTP